MYRNCRLLPIVIVKVDLDSKFVNLSLKHNDPSYRT